MRYRLYSLDNENHISFPPQMIEAETDAAAIEQARALQDGRDIELWDRQRLVTRLEHKTRDSK